MRTFGARLGSCIKPGQSIRSFAKQLGVSDTMLRKYLKDEAAPRRKTIARLARGAAVHALWLATGEGPSDIQPEAALSLTGTEREQGGVDMALGTSTTEKPAGLLYLPQLTIEASAGSGLIPIGERVEGYIGLREEYLREIGVDPRYAHVLRVSGRSMSPTVNDRDIVIIDTSIRTPVNEGVYTLTYGETVLIKRIRLQRDGGITLVSDNKSEGYADEFVPRSELATLSIVGRVKGHIRSL